jgi:hypothetical protein
VIIAVPIIAQLLLGIGVFSSSIPNTDESNLANAKERAEAASKVYQGIFERSKIDPNAPLDPEKLYQWSRRWMEAEQETNEKKEDRIAAAEAHLQRMKTLEKYALLLQEKKGLITTTEVAAQKFFRLEAERTLAQIKGK